MIRLLCLCLLLGGCQTMHEHPRATAIVAATLITSIALSGGHRERIPQMSEPLIATPSVDCTRTDCH